MVRITRDRPSFVLLDENHCYYIYEKNLLILNHTISMAMISLILINLYKITKMILFSKIKISKLF